MIVCRLIGWLMLFAAAVALVGDVITWLGSDSFQLSSTTDLWRFVHPESHQAVQAGIAEWQPKVLSATAAGVLELPAILLFGGLGLLLVLLCRPRKRKGMFIRH